MTNVWLFPDGHLQARSYGKVILTGEHAVVHGTTALVTAVDAGAICTIHPGQPGTYVFRYPALKQEHGFTATELTRQRHQIEERYSRFLKGKSPVTTVLEQPSQLVEYACCHPFTDTALAQGGCTVCVRSEIPVGCGMGSSAAVAVAVLRAVCALHHISVDQKQLFEWALQVECLQHGHPSGIDPWVAIHGGVQRYSRNGQPAPLSIPAFPFTLVHTGTPESTTGECVSHVGQTASPAVWPVFNKLEQRMEQALLKQDFRELRACVRENHRLLCSLGVVPDPVAAFIHDVESRGSAAKICGAGAIRGKPAGVVWAVDNTLPDDLYQKYGYRILECGRESK